MTVHAAWSPGLKSDNSESDINFTPQSSPHDAVFENPIPFDVPGVPRRFVFEPSQPTSPRVRHQEQPLPEGRAAAVPGRRGRLVGGSCDVGSWAAKPSLHLVALISTAWALLLSHHVDASTVDFDLSLSDRGPGDYPVHILLDRRQTLSDALRDVIAYIERLQSKNRSTDGCDQAGRSGEETCFFQSVLDIGSRGIRMDQLMPLHKPLVVSCLVDQHEHEVAFAALFEERLIQRSLLRFILSDLEHLVWQMAQPQAASLALKDLETVGPISQRAMRRLNRPLQPRYDCLVQNLIARHVTQRPEASAVDAWDGRLTYAQLDRQSSCLATHLVSRGVGPDVFVPILFEKSKLSIVAMLAVAKAGGAFMPLDPSAPLSRLHSMVDQAASFIAVSSVSCRGKMPAGVEEVVLDDSLLVSIATQRTTGPCCAAATPTPDSALYLIFTSGSTGKPKGVAVTHASFCSSAMAFRSAVRLSSPRRRALHYASPAFDASIMETLVTLLAGACICIPSGADRLDDIAKCIVDFQVNWAFLTPSVARLLRPENVPRLEVLCLGGEPLPRDLVELWADSVCLVNAYGPTECSIVAIVSDSIPRACQPISLGRPRGGAIWILNEEGNRVQSFNMVGEIAIEGPGVARGYLGDDAKTAAVFRDHADFVDIIAGSSSRFYRTGDLGRMNPDGTIDYLGRKDTQVKVNGQRIEMGEIEHQMRSILDQQAEMPALDVVVELLQPGQSRPFLAAFVGPAESTVSARASGQVILVNEADAFRRQVSERTVRLKRALSDKLPDYMIPRIILPCSSIPCTSSGKTDRKRLCEAGNALTMAQLSKIQVPSIADPCRQHRDSSKPTLCDDFKDEEAATTSSDESGTQDMPGTPEESLTSSEQVMRSIWADVLHISEEEILADDDFILLGGDSIGLIKIVAACRQAGIRTTVANLASSTVLQDMSTACEPCQDATHNPSAGSGKPFNLLHQDRVVLLRQEAAGQCDINTHLVQDLYPCTHTQEDLMVANMIHPGVSVGRFVHRLPDDVDVARFKKAWESVWRETPILRTRFTSTSSAGSLQVVVDGVMPWSESRSLEACLEADDAKPMLPGLPLCRFVLVIQDKTVHFVWTMHHMLYDGWSISLICRRVNALYHGLPTEAAPDFREFIAYSRDLDEKRSTEYWHRKLEGVASSTFPVPVSPGQAARADCVVSDHLELPRWEQQCRATMSTIVQAAWAIMISRFSQTTDVLFGATVSGRNAPVPGIDGIEGPTMTTVPVRLAVCSDCRIPDFLRSVRDHFTEMIPYEQTALRTIRGVSDDTKRGCDFQNTLVIQAGSVWESDAAPLGKPRHRGEDATVPVLCQAWLMPDGIDFDVVYDQQITCRRVVTEAIVAVKDIITQLVQLSGFSEKRLIDLGPGETNAVGWLGPESVKAVQATVHERVSEMSGLQPLQEAVCTSDTTISYRELDKLSSSLAVHLLNLDIGKGSILPLCFEKSVWTIVAMLATLKTGAAFVLLDPSQPQQRMDELVSQVEAQSVLVSPSQADSRSFAASMRHITVDGAFLRDLPAAKTDELPDVSPSDLAYIIFTSGSTGRPKGVMISHSAFATSAAAYSEALALGPKRRVLHFSSYSFDASLNETLCVLMHGGAVCVADERERQQDLADFVRRQRVDWAILTPSVARLLSPSDLPRLETLDLGGEAPDQALLSSWHQAGVRVFNVYGPAEGAGTALSQQYAEGVDPRTIGYPMGCHTWIVDANDHDILVADGQTGELVLEGPILAQGYFKDAQKTAQSFISNPKWAMPINRGSGPRRMYKTGDLVFSKADGAIDYVGRKDLQVKHHGQRIELGDIETNLAACSGVKRCAVFYPAAGPLKQQLVAIFETGKKQRQEVLPRLLRTELLDKIPGSMVPAYWFNADSLARNGQSLPLSLSGKLDRRLITARLEQLSADEAEQSLVASNDPAIHVEADKGLIGEQEQPAYTIATKIYEMLPARVQTLPASQGKRRSFQDLALQSSGLDSLNMMSVMYFMSRQFNAQVSMQFLMDSKTTIRRLAECVLDSQAAARSEPAASCRSAVSSLTAIDVMAEISRHDLRIATVQRAKQASSTVNSLKRRAEGVRSVTVLLTGGNGFIGTQILRQLLEHRQVSGVIAVVRGATAELARNRTVEAAKRARWWTDLHGEKLQVWPGDLSLPRLGLEPAHWGHLQSGHVDIVIHNGAAVHWAKSYAALEGANVNSTVELLCLTAAVPHMGLVYVTGGRDGDSQTDSDSDVAKELSSPDAVGYSQTKFVAEVLTKRAAKCCLAATESNRFAVIGPGLVIGTATEGVANVDDYIWRLAAACIKLGAYNAAQAESWVDISDAATMATTVVNAAFEATDPAKAPPVVTQVFDGMTWGQFWAVLAGMGYRLEARDGAEWLASMRQEMERCRESHPLWPLAHMLESQTSQEAAENRQGETPLRLKVAVRRNAEFLGSVGFLPRPASSAEEATPSPGAETFSRSGR